MALNFYLMLRDGLNCSLNRYGILYKLTHFDNDDFSSNNCIDIQYIVP